MVDDIDLTIKHAIFNIQYAMFKASPDEPRPNRHGGCSDGKHTGFLLEN